MENKDVNILKNIFDSNSERIYVEKPCRIIKVHSPYLVDVEFFDNNKSDILCKVPVKHLQTSRAFVFLTLRVGDRGTVRFLDNDYNNYLSGDGIKSSEVKKHNINDGIFCLGFFPNQEQYILPEKDISIGNTDGTLMTIDGNKIHVYGENVTINGNDLTVIGENLDINSSNINVSSGQIGISGGVVNISGNTQIDGRNFLQHVHREAGSSTNTPFTGGVI